MKNWKLVYVALICSSFACFAQVPVTQPKVKDANTEVLNGVKSGRVGKIDPAITDVTFTNLKLSTGDKLKVSIVLNNLGLKNFESTVNQQSVQLWEEFSSTQRTMVKLFPFTNLSAGVPVKLVYERPAFKPGKEFPPNYKAIIVYDPDIRSDNRPENDDADLSNNSITKNPRP